MAIANSSVYHDVPVIIQDKSWACWYVSFKMVVAYLRKRGQGAGLKDPSEVDWVQKIYTANKGIGADATERERVARALGFEVEYASESADGLWELMRGAPVIYGGRWPGQNSGHFVVFTGISENTLSINNPATGRELYDYGRFASQILLQTSERPLIYP